MRIIIQTYHLPYSIYNVENFVGKWAERSLFEMIFSLLVFKMRQDFLSISHGDGDLAKQN